MLGDSPSWRRCRPTVTRLLYGDMIAQDGEIHIVAMTGLGYAKRTIPWMVPAQQMTHLGPGAASNDVDGNVRAPFLNLGRRKAAGIESRLDACGSESEWKSGPSVGRRV